MQTSARSNAVDPRSATASPRQTKRHNALHILGALSNSSAPLHAAAMSATARSISPKRVVLGGIQRSRTTERVCVEKMMATWLTILVGSLSREVLASHNRRKRYRHIEENDRQPPPRQSLTTSHWWDLPSNYTSSGTAENQDVLYSMRQKRHGTK